MLPFGFRHPLQSRCPSCHRTVSKLWMKHKALILTTGILKEGTLIPWNRLYNDSTNIIAYAMLYNGNEMVIPSSRLCLWCCRAQINKATKTPIRIAPVTTPSIMYSMLSSGFLCWYPGRPASSLSPLSSPATPSLSYEDSAIPRLALTLNDGDNVDAGGHWSVPFDNINTPTNKFT